MILAAVGDTGYNIVLLLHILTAMAAFAPVFAHPFLAAQADSLDPAHKRQLLGFLVQNGRTGLPSGSSRHRVARVCACGDVL